ncbi:MAG: GntR family transcriptional regulator [Candidatus Nanopelagicales bacterium]
MSRRRTAAGPVAPDRSSPMPLWAQIAADLRRRLESGEFRERVPGELTLVDEYGVSRHTVREALRDLRQDGLVVASRGRGSFASVPDIDQPLGSLYSLVRSLESEGIEQRSEVRRLEVVRDADAAMQLELPASTRLVLLERRRFASGEPLAVDRAWLPDTVAHPLLDADFTTTALYDVLAERCGIHLDSGRERITAVLPSASLRRDLDLPHDIAALRIQRLARAGGRPVEWRETVVRGDRFHVVAEWSQSSAFALDLAPTPHADSDGDPTA